MYSIVKFDDGVEIVPKSWLSADQKFSKWPNYNVKDNSLRAELQLHDIKSNSTPSENWIDHPVSKVYKTPVLDTFDKANFSLQTILECSEGEDSEGLKKSRGIRKKKHFDSDESNDDISVHMEIVSQSSVPPVPNSLNLLRKNVEKHLTNTKKNSIGDVHKNKYTGKKRINVSDDKTFSDPEEENLPSASTSIASTPSTQQKDLAINPSWSSTSVDITSNAYILMLLEKKMLPKINCILKCVNETDKRLRVLEEKICTNSNNVNLGNINNPGIRDEMKKYFPVKQLLQLQNADDDSDKSTIEQKLKQRDFYNKTIQFFSNVGGTDAATLVRNILSTNFNDSVLINYSYQGRKKPKAAFNVLRVNACIHKAATNLFPNCTTDLIIATISCFLDQTKSRLGNENKRLSRRNYLNEDFNEANED